MERFWDEFGLTSETRVLDVGGSRFNWVLLPELPKLVMINITPPDKKQRDPTISWLVADGRHLPFKDKAFEIVYSNSVIEHLETRENQCLFASECRRVGVRYHVQTPNKWFLVEPHLLTPFIHWLPRRIQTPLLRNFTLWGMLTRPTRRRVEMQVKQIRLLGERELRELFPDAEIWGERWLGLRKSLIAVDVGPQGARSRLEKSFS